MNLDCQVQQYAWGKTGEQSEVARLKKSADSSFAIDNSKNYAEIWMGTHPSCPAKVGDILLSDFLQSKPNFVGLVPDGYDSTNLPFLFKVLSIKTALSIQAHPDKTLAKELFEKFPNIYKDPNHKPEMAVALTPFQALSGFRSVDDIKRKIAAFPELKGFISDASLQVLHRVNDNSEEDTRRDAVKLLFTDIMNCPEDIVKTQVRLLISRVSPMVEEPSSKQPRSEEEQEHRRLSKVMVQLDADYPGDNGVIMPLLLNYLELAPGEGFFMGPNEPHAYISGDCIEAMALSDNVVRAGLTPKLKDVPTLIRMLHYRSGVPELVPPIEIENIPGKLKTLLYRPSPDICSEFEIEQAQISVSAGDEISTHFRALPTASILLFIMSVPGNLLFHGAADVANDLPPSVSVCEGSVVFLPANVSAKVAMAESAGGSTAHIVYRTHVNMAIFDK